MHFDSAFLNWYAESEGGRFLQADAIFRPYNIWRHARDHISPDATDLDRIDVISALRRTVNHRLKSLRNTYNFDYLPSPLGKKQTLERLQEFGIVRSAIIKDLLEVRNLIEHEDSEPPEIERCRYYVDIVWYFLKSTDKLLDIRCEDFTFMHEDGKQFASIVVDFENNWRIRINAHLAPELLLESATPRSIAIENFVKKDQQRNGVIWVTGEASLKGKSLISLARGCFAAVGYWHDDNDS